MKKANVSLKRLAVFASGSGSNASSIFDHFQDHSTIKVELLICNRKNAGVIAKANRYGIPIILINRSFFYESNTMVHTLTANQIDFIALAGFLWLMPSNIIQAFPNRILNIHPALLPKYGGKGMYGMNVHQAVKAAGEKQSGMTIHVVNEQYDKGKIVFQSTVDLLASDSPDQIAKKVLSEEHRHYANVIESFIENST